MTATPKMTIHKLPPVDREGRRVTDDLAKLCRKVMDHFEPSGMTHDGSIKEGSSRILPERNEMSHRVENGMTIIERRMEDGTTLALACSDSKEVTGADFMVAYQTASYPVRAAMLGVDNPHRMNEEMIRHHQNEALQSGGGAYKSTLTHQQVTAHVTAAKTKSGKTRAEWQGHSAFGLARLMGSWGWNNESALKAFHTLQIPVADATVRAGTYAGRKGERGELPILNTEQTKALEKAAELAPKAAPPASKATSTTTSTTPAAKATTSIEAPPGACVIHLPANKADAKAAKRRAKDDAVLAEARKRKAAGK